MTEEFPYEVLFRWAFPEWKGDVPPLTNQTLDNLDEVSVGETSQEALEGPELKLTGKWFIWEVISNNNSNLSMDGKAEAAEFPQRIDFVRVHCFAPCKLITIDKNILPEFDENAVHFLPNSAWVFSIDPQFLQSFTLWDPIIAKWFQNTETFTKTQRIEPLSLIVKDGKLFETFISLYEASEQNKWISDIEIAHLRVLGAMHNTSFTIDMDELRHIKSSLSKELAALEKEIYQLSEQEFNILSPLEVSDVLFNKMQIPNPDTAQHSFSVDSRHRVTRHRDWAPTNMAVLEKIDHPIASKILRYRTVSKMISTWLSFDNHCDEESRLHPDFYVCATATGRISTRNPNLQNIPSPTASLNIRSIFLAGNEETLISLDYCQLELRILAHLSQDFKLSELCRMQNIDLHSHIANIIFSAEHCTEEQRDEAKKLVYATVYGKVPSRNCLDMGMRTQSVLDAFPGIREFATKTTAFATKFGFVQTLCGKRRYLPNIKSKNQQERFRDQRMAINTVVQGSAADFVKFALVRIMEKMKDFPIEPVLQLHDEWVFRTPILPDTVEFLTMIETLRQTADSSSEMEITVPIPCKILHGKNYGQMIRIV